MKKDDATTKRNTAPLVKPKIFLDADVLIAGSASTTGASYVVLQLSALALVECIISQQVMVEAERNLQSKLPQALPAFRVLLESSVRVVEDPSLAALKPFNGQADEGDLPILVAGLGSGCHYLLTFNTRHYYPTTDEIKIMPPGEFLIELRQQLLDFLSR